MHIATLTPCAEMKGCFVSESQSLAAFLIRVEMMQLLQIFSVKSSLACSSLRPMEDYYEPHRTPSVCHAADSLGPHWHDCSRPKVVPQAGRTGNAAQNVFLTLLTPTSLASQPPLSGSCLLLRVRLCRRLHVHFHINTPLLLQGAWYLACESHACSSSSFDQQTTQAGLWFYGEKKVCWAEHNVWVGKDKQHGLESGIKNGGRGRYWRAKGPRTLHLHTAITLNDISNGKCTEGPEGWIALVLFYQ